MKKKFRINFEIVCFGIITFLLFAIKLTGVVIHAILGMITGVVLIIHTIKKKKKIRYVCTKWQYVDYYLLINLVFLLITGILIHPFEKEIVVKILHGISSILFTLGCGLHIFWHKKI